MKNLITPFLFLFVFTGCKDDINLKLEKGHIEGDVIFKGHFRSAQYYSDDDAELVAHYPDANDDILLNVSATNYGFVTFQYTALNGTVLSQMVAEKFLIPDGENAYFYPYPQFSVLRYQSSTQDAERFYAFPTHNLVGELERDSMLSLDDPRGRGLLLFKRIGE